MEGGAVRIEQEDEEDQATRMENLALFEDMRYYYHQYGEEDSAAPPPPPHDLSTQLRDAALTGYRVSAHKGVGRDLLDSDSNKSDYDWLMTPPDTPLSSSSDQEAMVKAMQQQMIVRKVQPLISSIKSARKPGSGTERGETRMQRGNPSPQRASRSSTPTKKKQPLSPKPSTSPSRAAVGSSSQRPVTPTVRRSSTPTATLLSSTRGGAKMQSRNSSADVLPWNNSTSTTQRRSSTGSLFSSCTTSSRPFVSANPVPARTPSPTTITRQSFPDHTNNISRGSTPLRGGGRSQGSSPVRSSNNNNNFSRGRSPAKSHINRGNSLSSPRAILPVILDSFLSDTPVNLRTTDSRPSSQHAQLAAGYGHRGINQSSENLEKRTTKQSSIRRHSSSPTSKIQGSNSLLQSSRQHHWSGNSIDDNILVSSSSRRRVTIPEYDLDGRRLSTGSSRSSRDPPPLSNNAPSRNLLTKHYYYGSQAAQKDVATVGSAVLKRSLDSAAASRSSVQDVQQRVSPFVGYRPFMTDSSIPSFYSTRPGIVNKKSHLDSRPVTPTSLSSSGCSGRSLVSATVEERISSEAHEQHELQNIVMPSSSQKRALSNGKHSDNNVMQNSFDLGGNKDGVLLASDKLKEEALIQEVEKGLKSQKQEQVMKKHIGYSSQSLNSLTRTRNPLKDIDRGGSEHMEDLNHDGCTCYDVEEMPQEIIILNERAADMRLGNIGGVGGSRDQVYKRDTDIFCEASQEDNIGSVPQITSERQEVNRRETSNLRKEEELLDGGCEDPSSLSSQGCKNGEVTADDNDLRFENSSDVIGDSHGGAAGESSGDIKGREQVMRDRTPPTMSELKGEMDNAGDLLNEKPYQVAEEDCTGEHGLRGHAGSDIRFIDIQEDACGGFWQYSDAKTSPQDNAVALTTKLASAAKSSQIFRGSYRGGECRKDDYLQGSLMRSSVSMSSTSATSIDLSRSSDTISSTPSSASLESTHNGLNSGFQDLKSRSEIAQVSNGNKVVDVCSVEAQDVDKEARSVVRGKVNIKITANLYSDAKLKKLAGYVRTVSLNARNQKGTQDDQNGAEEILSHDGCFDYFMDVLASQKSLDPEMREPHANSDVLASSHALETSKGELSIEVDNPAIMKHLDSRLTSTSSLSEKQTSFRVTDTANASSNWELNKEDLGCSKPVPKLEVSGQSIGKIVEYATCLGSDTPKHLSSFKFGQKKTALGELENITTFEVGAEAMTLDSEQSISSACLSNQSMKLAPEQELSKTRSSKSETSGHNCDEQGIPALVVSGTMTLAEATDKILFCSSIVHDLVYAAVALVGENDTENKNATLLIGSKPTSLDHDLLSDPTHSNHLQEPKFSSYNDLKNVGELLQPSTETEAMNLDNHKQRPVTEYSLDLLSKERKLTKDDELLLMISPPPDKLNNDDNNNSEMRDRHTSRSCACSIL